MAGSQKNDGPCCPKCSAPAPPDRVTRCYACGNMVNTMERRARPDPNAKQKPEKKWSPRKAATTRRVRLIAAGASAFVVLVASLAVLLGGEKHAQAGVHQACDAQCNAQAKVEGKVGDRKFAIMCRVTCVNPGELQRSDLRARH